MKIISIVFFLLLTSFPILAKDFPEPNQIIQEEGKFIFTDGSSYYLFKKDGTFELEPLGFSGRIITGKWKLQESNLFIIQGEWSWMNGLSPLNDYRKMVIYIGNPTSSETVERLSLGFGSPNVKIYKSYFEIEELQKITKPEGRP